MTQGSCLCGAVRYEVEGPYRWFSHCHCTMCRKHHGTFHSSVLAAEKSKFRFLKGEDSIVHYRSSPAFARPFCKHCGSKVPDVAADYVMVPGGTIDGHVGMKPSVHIFVADKSPMESITDSLRQFDSYPEGFGTAMSAPVVNHAPTGTHGSCLCGKVAFEIAQKTGTIVQCHCSRCQRSRGTPHGVNTFVPEIALQFTRGAELVKTYRVPDTRFSTAFCGDCGSMLPVAFPELKMWLVPVGSLDTPFEPKAFLNIYVGSKASWFSITNPYPQFEELPPREQLRDLMFS